MGLYCSNNFLLYEIQIVVLADSGGYSC